jgi:hypothetical protein
MMLHKQYRQSRTIDSDTVLICVDEYFVGFAGSIFELLSTMEGENT